MTPIIVVKVDSDHSSCFERDKTFEQVVEKYTALQKEEDFKDKIFTMYLSGTQLGDPELLVGDIDENLTLKTYKKALTDYGSAIG